MQRAIPLDDEGRLREREIHVDRANELCAGSSSVAVRTGFGASSDAAEIRLESARSTFSPRRSTVL